MSIPWSEIAPMLADLPYRNEPERWRQLRQSDRTLLDCLRLGAPVTPRDAERLREMVERLEEDAA